MDGSQNKTQQKTLTIKQLFADRVLPHGQYVNQKYVTGAHKYILTRVTWQQFSTHPC